MAVFKYAIAYVGNIVRCWIDQYCGQRLWGAEIVCPRIQKGYIVFWIPCQLTGWWKQIRFLDGVCPYGVLTLLQFFGADGLSDPNGFFVKAGYGEMITYRSRFGCHNQAFDTAVQGNIQIIVMVIKTLSLRVWHIVSIFGAFLSYEGTGRTRHQQQDYEADQEGISQKRGPFPSPP